MPELDLLTQDDTSDHVVIAIDQSKKVAGSMISVYFGCVAKGRVLILKIFVIRG